MKQYKKIIVGRGFENKKFNWISLILDIYKIINKDYIKEKEIDLNKLFISPHKEYEGKIQLLFTLYKNLNKNKPNVTHNLAITLTDVKEEAMEAEDERKLYETIKEKKSSQSNKTNKK